MSALVLDTGFTIQFLLEQIARVEGDRGISVENLESFEAKKNENPAFMSRIIKVSFKWKKATGIDSVILKVPCFQNPGKQENTSRIEEFLTQAHTRECDFYAFFNSIEGTSLKLPKFYYGHEYSNAHNNGLLVMEDMSGFAKTDKMLPGFTNEQVENLIHEIAKIHVASWQHPEWIPQFGWRVAGAFAFVLECRDVGQNLRKIKGEVFNDLLDRMEPLFTVESLDKVSYVKEPYVAGIPPACVHTDLWAANILWKLDENGKITSEVAGIIDWQTCKAGNAAEDVLRLLASNCSSKYRRENTERLLKLYLNDVNKLMGKNFISYKQLYEAYHESMAQEAILAIFGAPLYCNMENVTGGPNSAQLKEELLDRTQALIEDTLKWNNL
ncbi:unnamed protein product [Bursaphelenchus xylophilus]|uniref:(pine wood nematode) hypothetical protein n=1 Tax=Bursaphelenchus xylophilus TaxID=6326 RepID=A0A1I7SQN6_BURXY|nr:unnamed protein product [Bursaphelenchus xylophilus]CAG9110150.1 unnamed protein product [Bursaphelenchus xylophilus]